MARPQGPMRPATDIPHLPGKSQDEFFYPDTRTLTLPWIYFFEKLARGVGGEAGGEGGLANWTYTITAGYGIGADCVVANDVCPPFEVEVSGTALEVIANCKTAPAGADLILDVLANNTSIFGADKLVIADGDTRGAQPVFAANPYSFAAGDRITVNCLQIGSTAPGKDVTLEIKIQAGS